VLKLVFCLHRRPELSRSEFQRYWRETHAALVARHAQTLRIQRYVQLHTLEDGDALNAALRASRGGPASYDGVAELWWASAEDLAAATSSDEGRRASLVLLEDEARFIDLARSPLFVTHENVVIG
jgi:uncharacterized protein (TIGR02118 family)